MADRFRIVGLADSFGRAGGHQNFHYLLEDRLNASGDEYEVVNISLGAIEMQHERKLLDRFAMRYHPDLVLHSFFVGNDFGSVAGDYVDFGGIHFHVKKGRRAFRPVNFALSQWGNRFLKLSHERWREGREGSDGGGTFSEASFLEIEKGKLRLFERNSEYLPRSWERAKENLRAIHRRAEEGGAVVVLVIHPDQLQVELGLRKRLAGAFGVNFEPYQLDQPQQLLRAYARKNGIHIVDLLEEFRLQGNQGGLYLKRDTHYNEAGNALAAQLIGESLLQEVLPELLDSKPGLQLP